MKRWALVLLFIQVASEAWGYSTVHFKSLGKFDSFQWAPPGLSPHFKFDIFYYVPNGLVLRTKASAQSLVFLHGGGSSTTTRKSAADTVNNYKQELIYLAEKENWIVVAPSSSGKNWGGHTRIFIRELVKLMRTELMIDPDAIGLTGHSMGSMGISRNAFFLADLFAFVMPFSGAMDPKGMNDSNLATFFNIPYHPVQGLLDDMTGFVDWTKTLVKKVKDLELRFQKKTLFEVSFLKMEHTPTKEIYWQMLSGQMKRSKRKLYQKQLYGNFFYSNDASTSEYFWLEAAEFTPSKTAVRSNFVARIFGNKITIQFYGKHNVRKLRVYLSQRMLDLWKPVTVVVNGITYNTNSRFQSIGETLRVSHQKRDPQFIFDQYVDLEIGL